MFDKSASTKWLPKSHHINIKIENKFPKLEAASSMKPGSQETKSQGLLRPRCHQSPPQCWDKTNHEQDYWESLRCSGLSVQEHRAEQGLPANKPLTCRFYQLPTHSESLTVLWKYSCHCLLASRDLGRDRQGSSCKTAPTFFAMKKCAVLKKEKNQTSNAIIKI